MTPDGSSDPALELLAGFLTRLASLDQVDSIHGRNPTATMQASILSGNLVCAYYEEALDLLLEMVSGQLDARHPLSLD